MKITLLLILIMMIVVNILVCQELHLNNFTTDDGLSQNSVSSSVITKEGFIWLATQDGLNRFDGKNFKVIRYIDENNKLPFSKFISHLFVDRNDLLWVASSNGILIYDRVNNSFLDPSKIYKGFRLKEKAWVVKMKQDKDNNLWILTNDHLLFKYDFKFEKTLQITKLPQFSDISLDVHNEIVVGSNNVFYRISASSLIKLFTIRKEHQIVSFDIVNESIWAIVDGRNIVICNLDDGSISDFAKTYSCINKISDPRLIQHTENGIVWIGSRSNGLCRVDLNRNSCQHIQPRNQKNSLVSPFILSICAYGNQTIIGQSGGGFALIDDHFSGISSFKSIDKMSGKVLDNMIFSLYRMNDEEFYSGTLYGGLLYTNTLTGKYIYYDPPINDQLKPEAKNIYQIIRIDNELWMASWGGLLSFNLDSKKFTSYKDESNRKTLQLTSIIKLKEQNKLLVGGYNGGIILFDLRTKKFFPIFDPNEYQMSHNFRPRYMKEMHGNNIYISSEENSFFRYNVTSGLFTEFPTVKSFSGTSRHFLFHKDKCYIATDDGLVITDTSDFRLIKIITTKEGLPNNFVYAIQDDEEDRLWVSSNAGITILNTINFNIINITDKHGLQGLEFNTASCEKDSQGNLYFGGTNGFSKIIPSKINFTFSSQEPIINEVRIMNQPLVSKKDVSYLDTIITDYNKNFITLGFQTFNVSAQSNATYRCKLSEVDNEWVVLSNRNYISYSSLVPGKYNFEVASYNIDGTWSKSRSIIIIVRPAWFQTWAFRLFSLFLLASISYAILWYRINQIRQKAIIEKDYQIRIKSLEMVNLRSQMNPHFMFNALNSINKFIVEKNTNEASDYLTKFSRLMRMILELSKQEVIPLSSEIEALQLYLLIEANRFENRFKYEIVIEKEVESSSINIPPLILQPFVENAIWHGLLHNLNEGMISIHIQYDDNDHLEIVIMDNGIGRRKAQELKSKSGGNSKSYGMAITKERILNASRENQLLIEDLFDEDGNSKGTLVKIILSL